MPHDHEPRSVERRRPDQVIPGVALLILASYDELVAMIAAETA